MVELTAPTPTDLICDPAAGTCGFLVAAGEYLRHKHPEVLRDPKLRKHFHEKMFNGFDFDPTMLRIGSMNTILHGVENAHVVYRDSLAEEHNADAGRYSLVLANPPFAGSLDYEATAKDLSRRQDQEDRVALPRLSSSSPPRSADAPPSSCRTACCSCPSKAHKDSAACSSRTTNSMR
jgi:type I restriction-modification system DNA methylase subunit